jgi:intracellular multiplication protein IcmC
MLDSSHTSILINIAKSLIPVQNLITGAAYIVGISFALKALYSLKIYGESKTMQSSSTSIKDPLFHLMVAGFLIFFPTGFEVIMNSTFGYSNVLAYSDSSLTDSMFGGDSQLGNAVVIIFQTIGLYAFTRGWILIARAASQGQQPGGTGKGLMHVFGGVLAVNIVGTIELLKNTLFG